MQKFTPGPWKYGNTSSDQIMLLGGRSENYVCHVQIEQTGGGSIAAAMEPERRANARLISAAPELLEALSALVDAATAEVNEKGAGGYMLARLSDARVALAKATGA